MSGLGYDPDRIDLVNNSYLSGSISITTTQIEAKVGASALALRQAITITNTGAQTIYYGPTGLTAATGKPLFKNQDVAIPVGPSIQVFILTASGTSTAIIQEWS